MTKSNVYVVQKQMRFDTEIGELVPRFNLEPAKKYGSIKFLLSPTANPFNPNNIVPDLHDKLCDITPEDHLLLLGNPCLIGLCCTVAAHYTDGRLNLLQWRGIEQEYVAIRADGLFCDF